MHGRGMITYADGTVVKGIWVKDKLNGLASVQRSAGQEKKHAIFKDGMQINLEKEPLRLGHLICSLIFMFVYYGALGGAAAVDPIIGGGAVLVAIMYTVYLCCANDTCKYMRNLFPLEKVFQQIGTAIASPPTIRWSLDCYHYETRIDVRRNAETGEETI